MKNVIEKLHLKRLEDKGIVIEEIFKNVKENTIYIRTSDGKECDAFTKCPKIERNYYLNGKLLHRETDFDQHVLYSYNTTKNSVEKCTECGYESSSKDFFEGCPYCGSQFNVEYISTRRNTSGKAKPIPLIFDKKIALIVGIISLIISVYFNLTGAEVSNLEMVLNTILATIMFYVAFNLFLMPVYIIWFLIKGFNFKDFPNSIIKVNGYEISSMQLLKDLQSELKKYYYYKNPKYKNLIDYEIIDYKDYQVDCSNYNLPRIHFIITIRKYYLQDNKIITEEVDRKLTMMKNNNFKEKEYKMRKCLECGAPIEGMSDTCIYCHKKNTPNKQWILEKII